MAMDEGRLARNVVRLVTPPTYKAAERDTWSRPKCASSCGWRKATDYTPPGCSACRCLRRGEVLGLCGADVDLKVKTLTVVQTRVLVDYKVRIEEPKSTTASGPFRSMTISSRR